MMRNTITRTLFTSDIHGVRTLLKDGQPEIVELPVLSIPGKASQKDAERALRREYGRGAALTVKEIVIHEDVYEISVEDFLKHATKVEKTQTKNN